LIRRLSPNIVIAELLEQHAGDGEKAGQPVQVGQSQQAAYKSEAVEAAEGALNLVLVPRYKRLHGVVSGWMRVLADSL
jgi:hypothetical protein